MGRLMKKDVCREEGVFKNRNERLFPTTRYFFLEQCLSYVFKNIDLKIEFWPSGE